MHLQKESPVLRGTGLPNTDLLGSGISSEDTNSIRLFQVYSLTRRCAISAAMAAIVAPLVFGEGGR